ncbi:hypothetical protein QCA50_001858 [Cerrena zonata]|uniref:Zinc finger CHCC-type domain-containing protein n=1 Tax=Cerrena zonata TaxID=2478898 RepID=A0AAW0GU49_9APHY
MLRRVLQGSRGHSPDSLRRHPLLSPAEAKAADLAKVPVGVQQAPNHPTTWSTNQRARPGPQSGARFEQTIMELQPQPLAAIEMIANEPIRVVHGRKAVCDGGGGPLGHPKIFINLDKAGPRPCGYVQSIRFINSGVLIRSPQCASVHLVTVVCALNKLLITVTSTDSLHRYPVSHLRNEKLFRRESPNHLAPLTPSYEMLPPIRHRPDATKISSKTS